MSKNIKNSSSTTEDLAKPGPSGENNLHLCSKPSPAKKQKLEENIQRSGLERPSKNSNISVKNELMEYIKKSLKGNEAMIANFKTFIDIMESGGETKRLLQRLFSIILNYAQNSTPEEIKKRFGDFQDLKLPENLNGIVIDRNALKQIHLIGRGDFGIVHAAILKKKETKIKVAIKEIILDDPAILINEADILSQLQHPHIVKLVGVLNKPFGIVMEYLSKGSLSQALVSKDYSDKEILKAIQEIACGMEYLGTKRIIHRDLIIQNILVDEHYHCKIGDFGYSCYIDKKENHVDALKYLDMTMNHSSPEVMFAQQYSTQSDVYSMGLLIWEIYMYVGKQQNYYRSSIYAVLKLLKSDFQDPCRNILNKFHRTGELLRPKRMPERIHFFIKSGLLNIKPEDRPTFTAINKLFKELLK